MELVDPYRIPGISRSTHVLVIMHSLRCCQIFADWLQFIGIDIFDRHITGLQQFHKLPWDLNTSLLNAPGEYVNRERFNMINSRFLTDGIYKDRWEPLIREYKLLLKPGGWLQMVEVRWRFLSRSDKALPNLTAWSDEYMNALSSMKKDPKIIARLEQLVRFAGFEGVEGRTCNIPVGNWRPGSCFARVGHERPSAD